MPLNRGTVVPAAIAIFLSLDDRAPFAGSMRHVWPESGFASILFPQRRSITFIPCRLTPPFLAKQESVSAPPFTLFRPCQVRSDRPRPLRLPSRPQWSGPKQQKRNMTMATIGTFTSTENGFTGSIRTLALNVKARIARIENPSDKGPQFRIFAGSVDYAESVIMRSACR